MSEEKIKVISACRGRCGIDDADLRISRRWKGRGDAVLFTRDQLEELMFNPAFMNMVREGKLYIWKDMPLSQFKVETKTLTNEQIKCLAEYAIQHGDEGSIDKANYLSKISGYKILKGIELEKQSKEE